jgi:hypothetical protein
MLDYWNKCPEGYTEMYPEGTASLINLMFPIIVDLQKKTVDFEPVYDKPKHIHEIKFVLYDETPYGLLGCDKPENDPSIDLQTLWPEGPIETIVPGECLRYHKKVYRVGRCKKMWDIIRMLAAAKGELISIEGNPQASFKTKDADEFWHDAIDDRENPGRGGNSKRKIYEEKRRRKKV